MVLSMVYQLEVLPSDYEYQLQRVITRSKAVAERFTGVVSVNWIRATFDYLYQLETLMKRNFRIDENVQESACKSFYIYRCRK